jgi:Tat protein secretion system quality control protein TatD with DNase activity
MRNLKVYTMGKKYHDDDSDDVIERASKWNVQKMLFAYCCLDDLHISHVLTQKSEYFYTTIGIHHCRALTKKII